MKWKFWQSTDSDLEQAEVTEGENPKSSILRVTTALIGLYLVAAIIIGVIWSREPAGLDDFVDLEQQSGLAQNAVTGTTTTVTFIAVADKMLNKSGGYLSNDIFPPGVWLDNMHNWEFGVLTLLRDTARVLSLIHI